MVAFNMWFVTVLAMLKPTLPLYPVLHQTCSERRPQDAVVPVREEWDTEMHNWRPLQLYFVYDPYVEEDTPQELYNLSQKIIAVLCRRTPNWSPETPFLARVSGTAKLSKSEEFTYLSVHREGGVVYATPGQAEDYLAVNSEASLADLVIFVISSTLHHDMFQVQVWILRWHIWRESGRVLFRAVGTYDRGDRPPRLYFGTRVSIRSPRCSTSHRVGSLQKDSHGTRQVPVL
ncbi:uncharacterized protein LOC135371150 isoform X3 [Ornithodoros turicata]|uniref:uncharacterized protein LOC135371150 isoform X3 n=1 Tax=Ornithodoros turicata TaxID=34597 RepID=UPI00313864A0